MSSPHIGTKPESFVASHKRVKGTPSLYSYPLPLLPSSASFISTLVSSLILPYPSLTPPRIEAIYDPLTRTIWIRDETTMQLVWRRGFFGKGNLSRSEPSWKRRVENQSAQAEGRQKNLTSEEITALRRIERKGTKQVKKVEREAERLLAANIALGTSTSSSSTLSTSTSTTSTLTIPPLGVDDETPSSEPTTESTTTIEADQEPTTMIIEPRPSWQLDIEHTQLEPEEAFFLLFSLGSILLRPSSPFQPTTTRLPRALSILETWQRFLLDSATVLPSPSATTIELRDPRLTRWDSPFLLSYASYHHYRSLGWVVRSGVKFCTDWVLYGTNGPVGGHAEFAVIVYPNYVDPSDALSNPFKSSMIHSDLAEGEKRSTWRWLHTANRVCSGVKKTLVLLQIVIPPMKDAQFTIGDDPAKALSRLQMREIVVKRFSPGRMRD